MGATAAAVEAAIRSLKQNGPSYNAKNQTPDNILAGITNREQQRFTQLYRPLQQDLISSLNDRSIVDGARATAAGAGEAGEARTLRNLRRYGLQQSPVEAQQAQRMAQIGQSLDFDSTINDARIEQKERNDGLRRQLIDVGRGVSDTANSGLGQAAGLQAQRDANNAANKAAGKAQTTQMLASAAMIALAFI